MPDEKPGSARERFARDLRRIREDRGVSAEDVHQDTQMSTSQIEAFEAGKLFDQPSMNTVYLRAFVRAYAEAIGISTDTVLGHLDQALEGTYENEAAVQFLGVPPAVAEEDAPSASPSSTEASEPDVEADSPETQRSSREGTATEKEGSSEETSAVTSDAVSEEASKIGDSGGGEENESEPVGTMADPPDWLTEEPDADADSGSAPPVADNSTSSVGTSAPASSPERSRSSEVRRLWRAYRGQIIMAAVALVVVLAAVAGGILISDDPSPSSSQEMTSANASLGSGAELGSQADTNATERDRRPPASISLGDTMYVTVFAEGPVRGMRVRQDDDLRRPYWIEAGEATVFPFTNRIAIQDRLDSVRVFFERYPYPTSRTDDEGRIVIDRQAAELIVDTLRGSPVSLAVDPDTIGIRTPPTEGGAQ